MTTATTAESQNDDAAIVDIAKLNSRILREIRRVNFEINTLSHYAVELESTHA